VRRQQTLRASVDWSHALLTEPERILFRRLAAFMGGFDLTAAESVGGGGDVERYQVLDQLTLLVDKSLVVAESAAGPTRYRLLETVRQYAQEKLGESGDADVVRARHRNYYTSMASELDKPDRADHERRLDQVEIEIDNLRAAFAWSREHADTAQALTVASSLQPLWLARGQIREGLAWLEAAIAESDTAADSLAQRARALADKATLESWLAAGNADHPEEALTIAREVGDPALLARALTASGCVRGHNSKSARPYFAEALGLARSVDDAWLVSQIRGWQAYGANMMGNPIEARAAAEEGRDFADSIGDRFVSRQCRWCLGHALLWRGDLAEAAAQFEEVAAEAESAHDLMWSGMNRASLGWPLTYQGQTEAAEATAQRAIEITAEIGGLQLGHSYTTKALAALAAGDPVRANTANESAWPLHRDQPEIAAITSYVSAEIALALSDLDEARRWADEAVAATPDRPCHAVMALTVRARVAVVEGQPELAEDSAHRALAHSASVESYLAVPDLLECLAGLASSAGSHQEATRLLGAADAVRKRFGIVRFKIYDDEYNAVVARLREALGDDDFESAWRDGAALSADEAIAYAQRGRGERKRPASGWASLTPTELDVVRLLREGLPNKDIAERLFISPRTVQTHLTHAYAKLGLTSRVQLAQEAARHA
jgi:predicted ATPase/DNA-binding CsgD family transcriptional regulator